MKAVVHRIDKRRVSTSARRRRGFTLTELLIVMAILVLLVSMVGPRILGSKKKADINSTRTQIGLFETTLERYAIDMNIFPSTEQGLHALVEPPVDESEDSEGVASKWDGPYLKKSQIPLDPWGGEYQYEYPATHGSARDDQPDIWSFGPDREEGTEDDIFSWSQSEGESGEMADVGREPIE